MTRVPRWRRALLIVVVLMAPLVPATSAAAGGYVDPTFTLVVIPDTQLAVQNKPELFNAQTEWIAQQRDALGIPFVIHLGDLVEWPARISDWERAAAAMHRLDGVVPYAVTVGNHDLDAWACTPEATCDPWPGIEHDRSTVMFNTYFPWSAFRRTPTYRASHPARTMDNSWFAFRAGGVRWLVLNLKFRPTDDELAWANRVIARHPDRQVIINTHEYQQGDARTATGERIWQALGRRHANVQFILSGHYTRVGRRVDAGDAGNPVYQIQADYQTYSLPRVNENSYLRTMAFDTRAGTVSVRTFSPYCAATGECPAHLIDGRNEFTLAGVPFPVR
ncbi:calcineurin-like phosphoesterase family protein [Krasilnikovia cinnamomea]|uniref:Calcineurin-like phosphoesterase family protein n=1 Tax=Krasilnikovia cinnamomea TaxID=349313 RepID=A0A4Q7ZHV8_9ACTN|nr:metallophosphoesterase [Krasilnikovia cinnamomea]RZU49679.1 calcineurin-like phosphoesterase family protein [Krasilnikovia cinnamomea]